MNGSRHGASAVAVRFDLDVVDGLALGHAVRIIVARKSLAVSTSGSSEGIELSGTEVSLRFDEGSTVVAHGLVTSVGVLGHERPGRCPQDHDQDDKGEDDVDDEEKNTHDTDSERLHNSC